MKAKKHQFLAALSMVGFTLTISLAHAANLYWDGGSVDIVSTGDGVSAGTAGTWNTTLLNWDQGNALAHVAWNNANNDTAIFGGATAGAISITAPITVGGLTFTKSGYTFTGAENVSIATNGVLTGSAGVTSPATNLFLAAGNTVYRVANPAATFGNTNTFTVGSILTGASNSVEATGTGLIVISASSTYKGTTTITPGATLRYDGVIDNIGTIGTRDITVGAGGSIMRSGGSVNNAFLNRLAENNNEITIYMGNANNANNLDFSSSTGANLPNASIAFYDSAGTPSFQYTGTITPANNTYRLGGTKASAANNTSLPNVNALTGARSVVVTGGNVRILNSNDFTGTITINAGNFNISGNVNASNATVNGNGSIGGGMYAGDITTNGAMIHSSSATQTLSGLITGSGSVSRGSPGTAAPIGSTATPIDAGTLILTNPNNAYTGITSASTGTISFNSIANVGGGVSSLGAPTTITNGTIPVGGAFLTFRSSVPIITPRSGTLVYTGNGHISDRVIDLAGTSGGATINSSGGDALQLTSNMTATGIGSKTLTLTGSNSNNNRIGGAIVNNSTSGSTTLSKSFETGAGTVTLSSVDGISTGATITGTGIAGSTTITGINSATKIVTLSANTNATANTSIVGLYTITGVQNRTSLAKEGAGKWVLGGTNTFTGSTTVSGGTLMLDYSTNDTSKLADTGILTMAGGILDLSGGTHTEIVASTTLVAGTASSVTSSTPGSVLQMGLITTNLGASINFSAPSIATTDTTNTNGILGSWATIGTDWATNSTNAALGPITAYNGYADIDARGPSTIADGASTNVRIAGDGTSGNVELVASTVTINTLLQNNATFAATINTTGKNLITDAIWIPAGKAGLVFGVSAEDGTLSPKVAGGNLLLQNDGSNDLTINAVLIDNSTSFITKAGTGTVTLNATNTYAGGTFLSAGTLVIGNSSALGTGPLTITGGTVAATGTQVTTNLVNANGDFSIGGTGSLTLGDILTNANRIITNNNTTANSTLGAISGATRNLTFSGNGNTEVTGIIGTTTGTLTKNGAGTLTLSNSNTFTGVTTISSGTLQLGNGIADGSIGSTASITNNASLVFNIAGGVTVNKVISGTGNLVKMADGTVTLSSVNTYSGDTYVVGGTLAFASGGSANNSIIRIGELSGSNTATLSNAASTTVNSILVVRQGSSGTKTIKATNSSGTSTYGGSVYLDDAVTISEDNFGGKLAFTGADFDMKAQQLTVTGSGETKISSILQNSIARGLGKIVMQGDGILVLAGANTYAGNTEIDNGTIRVDATPGNADSAYYVGNGGTASDAASLLLGGAGGNGGGVTLSNLIAINPGTDNNRTLGGTNITGTTNTFAGTTYSNGGNLTVTSTNAGATLAFTNAEAIDLKSANALFNGAGNTTVSGALYNSTGAGSVTKDGTGTLTLSFANTYTGATSVTAGTLALVGGSQTSPITLSSGASLGFTLDSPTTTTKDVDISLGTIKITGTPTLESYDLITSSVSITGTPVLASPISGYELKVESNVLKLKKAGYASWASTNTAGANLADDHDNDGVSNGIEYFLGGPAGNTTGFTTLPSVVKALDGTLSVTWPKGLNYAGVYSTDYVVETSATLNGVWTAETIGGGNITDSGTEVKFTFPGGPTYSGKNFARLRVTGP